MNRSKFKASITFRRPDLPVHLITPYNCNEVTGYNTNIDTSVAVEPVDYRPFGKVWITGDVEKALPALLPWIDETAVMEGTTTTWREAISQRLLQGKAVDFDQLPSGVILSWSAVHRTS